MNSLNFKSSALRGGLIAAFFCGLLLGLSRTSAEAYVLEPYHWPDGQEIVLCLQLDSGFPVALFDGSTSWNQVAESAVDVWNPYLGSGVQFEKSKDQFTPRQGDGRNSVFFNKTIYGEAFGEDVLAVTLTLHAPGTSVRNEADVIFNSAQSFNSYRGALRYMSARPVYDLRRVAIHEFGHVLGLGHVAQRADSIMTPVVTNYDTVQADDIAGVQALYGHVSRPVITSAATARGQSGKAFSYHVTATDADTVTVSGLPAGLRFDPATEVITGTPQADGIYRITLKAVNDVGTTTVTLVLTVLSSPVIAGGTTFTMRVGVPFSHHIRATNQPSSYTATGLPPGLRVNQHTGLISGTPGVLGAYGVLLTATNASGEGSEKVRFRVTMTDDSLVFLHDFTYKDGDGPYNPPIQAADGNFYGTTGGGGPGDRGIVYKLTPNGVLSTVHAFTAAEGVYNYGAAIIQGSDGNFYGTSESGVSRASVFSPGTVYRLTPEGVVSVVHAFSGAEGQGSSALVQGTDGNLYGTTDTPNTGYDSNVIFKLATDGTFTTLHVFHGKLRINVSPLMQARDGNFYGTTEGWQNYGTEGAPSIPATIFRISSAGEFKTVYAFPGLTVPTPALLQASDGALYGTTYNDGTYGEGTIFRFTLDGKYSTLHSFLQREGLQGTALIQASDGNIYGTASSGGDWNQTNESPQNRSYNGTIFAMSLAGKFAVLYDFDGTNGISPRNGLVQGRDGYLYGVTADNDSGALIGRYGAIFRKKLVPLPDVQSPEVPTASVVATKRRARINSGHPGVFTVSFSAPPIADTTIHYTVGGTAREGIDYYNDDVPGSVVIKAGTISTEMPVYPTNSAAAKRTVIVTLTPGDSYTAGAPATAKMKFLRSH